MYMTATSSCLHPVCAGMILLVLGRLVQTEFVRFGRRLDYVVDEVGRQFDCLDLL